MVGVCSNRPCRGPAAEGTDSYEPWRDSVEAYQLLPVKHTDEEANLKAKRHCWIILIHYTKWQQLDYNFPLIDWKPTCVDDMPIKQSGQGRPPAAMASRSTGDGESRANSENS